MNKLILSVIFLSTIVLCFTIPFKNKEYIFDWDQANDYEATAKIAGGKLTLIGPRVTSDSGFFLGPWHYYFLTPFYKITGGNLDMGFWAALGVQWVLVIVSFIIVKKWFGTGAGVATGMMVATSGTLVEWGFMYVPLLSLLFLAACLKTFENPKLLPWLFLFFGFGCTTYTVFYALGIPFFYVVVSLLRDKKTDWKKIFTGVGLAAIPYLPLMLFDLRHNFLNFKNMIGFAGGQQGQGAVPGYFVHVFMRALNTWWLGRELPVFVSIFTVMILVYGGVTLFKKNKIFILFWLVSSLIPMAFYKGNVSEYYYAPVVMLIPIFMSGLLVKKGIVGKSILIVLVVLLVGLRYKNKLEMTVGITLADKIGVVEELEKIGSKYSVSYELGLGEDSGYQTVFKNVGKNYVDDGSAQLYTITYKDKTLTSGTKVATLPKLAVYKR